tara:strand:- start:177 stop:890 length:714 start_codon:yes stop_codon:yes gene_type:complete
MNTNNKFFKAYKLLKDKIYFILISLISNEEKKFKFIYKNKYWQNIDNGSLSGAGSNLDISTEKLSKELPSFFKTYKISSILDLPCGDWKWMSKVNLNSIKYTGCDIVDEIVDINNRKYSNENIKFIKKNLINDNLPEADFILVRDLLVHLKSNDIILCLGNIKKYNYKYIAITNFPSLSENINTFYGDRWRPINLSLEPFNLPVPDYVLSDESTIGRYDSQKTIAIWKNENFYGWRE